METYEVSQALMSVGTVYHVRRPREEAVEFTVRGELMSAAPSFTLVQGEGETVLGRLTANFIKTKYEIVAEGQAPASISFPAVAFKKTLTLRSGEAEYEADGGVFKGVFQCKAADGTVVLEIAKALSIRDTFTVKVTDALPYQVALLAAVAIHSRFYEMV